MAGRAIRLLRKKEQDAREKTVFIHEFIPGTGFLNSFIYFNYCFYWFILRYIALPNMDSMYINEIHDFIYIPGLY